MKNLSFRVGGDGSVTLLSDAEALENNSFGAWAGFNHKSGVPGYRWAIWPVGVTYVQICESELARKTQPCRPKSPEEDVYPPAIKAVLSSEVFAEAVKDWPVKPVLPKVYRDKQLTPRAWLVNDGELVRLKPGSDDEQIALSSEWAGYSEPAGLGLYWWYWSARSGERVCLVNRQYDGGPLPADAIKARVAFLAVWEKIKDKPKYAGLHLPVAYQEELNDRASD